MPEYVYTCPEHKEIREEVEHGFYENPVLACPECASNGVTTQMHRVPQSFRFGFSAYSILLDRLDEDWRRYKTKKSKERVS